MNEARWCRECDKVVPVEDRFEDERHTTYGTETYTVTVLDCGHSRISNTRITGPAPGEPWAPGAARDLSDLHNRRVRGTDPEE